ncbi:hypothetical protein ABFT23_02150 [Nocardioides sp. C4-1]|uniref:hypothetical protein n=1 Tax=Nocardioides sp. C4-1 TaxID=3151851 RepID=UPI0032671775
MSLTQGILFVPIVILGKLWFGLDGIVWALTVTESAVLVAGVLLLGASRRAIARGLEDGSVERAEDLLEQVEV